MMDENIHNQKEKESQIQLQKPKLEQSATDLTQPEMMEFVKLTRYTSLASGRLAESLIKMTSKLEDEGYLRSDRPSRLNRDKKLRSYSVKLQKSDTEISNMMKLIPNHPDGEKLIQSLFNGIKNFNTNNSLDENGQQQINMNNEMVNDQNVPNQLDPIEIPDINAPSNNTSVNQSNNN